MSPSPSFIRFFFFFDIAGLIFVTVADEARRLLIVAADAAVFDADADAATLIDDFAARGAQPAHAYQSFADFFFHYRLSI